MILRLILACLAGLSLGLLLWQWLAARRFPLHRRSNPGTFTPPVTLLKPLKGCDEFTQACLRSWFLQEYSGSVQLLFGAASADDPVCAIVRKLQSEFPAHASELIITGPPARPNAKIHQLTVLQARARHELLVISDADVLAPRDFLKELVVPFEDRAAALVCCFYRLANPQGWAMEWEALAVNADFWSQVLQALDLRPLDFALGAVMATRRDDLASIGGFPSLANCLADDYQLGNRLARQGRKLALISTTVECWSGPMNWGEVWRHQLRWARTIRACQPVPYFFSILSNATLWPALWLVSMHEPVSFGFSFFCWALRGAMAMDLEARSSRKPPQLKYALLAPIKDLLQAGIWLGAFLGNKIEWRGHRFRLKSDGDLVAIE